MGDGLVAEPGEGVLYAGGGTVLPGLHDHHVHILSPATSLASFRPAPRRSARKPNRPTAG